MSVPFIDLKRRIAGIRNEIDSVIKDILDSGVFILGTWVERFEKEMASFVGTNGAVGMSSGTDALLVSLKALGIKEGDEVITTPYTFFATAGSIMRCGARVVFADIEAQTYNLDPQRVLACISPKTKAVVLVHLFGQMADMESIRNHANHIMIVEDSAQAIGAQSPLGKAGGIGICSAFSFFPTKNLGGIGDGGAITSNDEGVLQKVRLLRNHGSVSKGYHHDIGGNFRLDEIQAGVLTVMFRYIESWNKRRRDLADRYRYLIHEAQLDDFVTCPKEKEGFRHVYHHFVVRVRDRDLLSRFLFEKGIGNSIYYRVPLHLQPALFGLGYKEGDFPEAEKASRETLALPMFPELTEAEQEEVVQRIVDFYKNHGIRSC